MFYPCAVVAGDGQQQLYIGREAECQNMARKFTGAFLDGAFVALAAAPQPPEAQASVSNVTLAAPVELPEPVAFALEWMFNGEERGMRLYDDETHCRFDAESDGGVCHPLYTEQQVRQLLAARLKPLTDEQWTKIWADWFDSAQDAEDLIRSIEKAHGITQENQG